MTKHNNRDLIPMIIGESTEMKPTDDSIDDGTVFYERDTKKKYTYRKENKTWYEGAAA